MAEQRIGNRGFSLVELLVALMFTMILMAGMATVFKSSISSFYMSSEKLSSARRNRTSIDLLYDDLNSAGMYLESLDAPPPALTTGNPAFYIIPNVEITGAGDDDPKTTDELYFYLDEPLPFEGALDTSAASPNTASQLVESGLAPVASDKQFVIDCKSDTYAGLVKQGQSMIFKDFWESVYIASVAATGSTVTITVGPNPNTAATGLGYSGAPAKAKHVDTSAVLFYQPGQMVKYFVKMVKLDPQKPGGIPCLVRQQGIYTASGFSSTQESIVTENIGVDALSGSGFKVYLSANSGASWAGFGETEATGFNTGWTQGLRSDLNSQLAAAGRPDVLTTSGNEQWFRDTPVLVRVDLTTRTVTKRGEYSPSGATADYKNLTKSMVLVPRHFGLPLK